MNRELLSQAKRQTPLSGAFSQRAVVQDVLRSPGRSLDSGTRSFMESRFGQDFSSVRVHTGAAAAASARAVDALAYTVGREVVFSESQYAPGTPDGRRLLAHELTHVVQQRGAAAQAAGLDLGPADDMDEQAAKRTAQQVAAGGRAENPTSTVRSGLLQRQPPEGPSKHPTEEARKKTAEDKVVVTQPAAQKIPAAEVKTAKKKDKEKPPVELKAGKEEKKEVETEASLEAGTETKLGAGKPSTEFAAKYKLGITFPITDQLRIGKLSFFKEAQIELSAPPDFSMIEKKAALKLVSLDFEKVRVPLGFADINFSASALGGDKFGFSQDAELKFQRSEKTPWFIKLGVNVEETYDKSGNVNFKFGSAEWSKTLGVSLGIGKTF